MKWQESKIEPMLMDTNGDPLIIKCPASGCENLDLNTVKCADGRYIVTCGSGHVAFMIRKDDEE
jgi:hypothetical protein